MKDLHQTIRHVEQDFARIRALVVGDVMIDKYIWGRVERISPEAPVPVVHAGRRSHQPGGAANVAMNLAGLGAAAAVVGFVGQDEDAGLLGELLREHGIESALVPVAGRPTISKTRIVGANQQMLRLDVESAEAISEQAYADLLSGALALLAASDVLVLSDYAKGALSEQVCQALIARAREQGIPVLVDPKQVTFQRYRGATTICPNLAELSLAVKLPRTELSQLLEAGQAMVEPLGLDYLTVTMSEKGIAILYPATLLQVPAVARQVFDVSGAGDTVIATLALCAAARVELGDAVELANIAAGIVVAKVGTVPVARHELVEALSSEIELHLVEKVLGWDQLRQRVEDWRASGERIVFTNGCFDILHLGHITLLERARREGSRLVVGINADSSVSRLKGPTRPVVTEMDRAHVLAALAAVDAVAVFDQDTPLELIEYLKPDVLVKGGDYTEGTIVGAAETRARGGNVVIVPTVKGRSTTGILARSREKEAEPAEAGRS